MDVYLDVRLAAPAMFFFLTDVVVHKPMHKTLIAGSVGKRTLDGIIFADRVVFVLRHIDHDLPGAGHAKVDGFVTRLDLFCAVEAGGHFAVEGFPQAVGMDGPEAVGQLLAEDVRRMYAIVRPNRRLVLLARKKDQEEHRRDENIHPDGIQVAHPSAGDILAREKAGTDDQVLYRDEELAVEMGDILKKMADEVADAFFRFEVFLATVRAESFRDDGPAIQTGLVVTKMVTAHGFFLKI